MNKRFEIKIGILNKDYSDSLIIALARQGYAPYINEEENIICFAISEDELIEIKRGDN